MMEIAGTKGSRVSLEEHDSHYMINISLRPWMAEDIEVEITKSPLMEEWNVAYPPNLYRSTSTKRFVLQNAIVCDIDEMTWC